MKVEPPVRRRFKSAPRSGCLAVLTQCSVLCPTPAGGHRTRGRETPDISPPNSFKPEQTRDRVVCDVTLVLAEDAGQQGCQRITECGSVVRSVEGRLFTRGPFAAEITKMPVQQCNSSDASPRTKPETALTL
ncbi:hypothetical protein F2P81_018733 [Scophthalmus maximus]|uniref:Uncharacterized protein n=1 Tax=Scophthalmus maximus TaxID=52904 RepID=A0A6A4SBF4_SCOMX|nr:hypothetical protein F2P81_018733 [Scophthalmus maximus]